MKRSADLAIKKGVLIKTASDMYAWGSSQKESTIKYILVTDEEIVRATEELTAMDKFTIPGAMTVHSVMPHEGVLYTKETSCFSECCWSAMQFSPTCQGWKRHDESPTTSARPSSGYTKSQTKDSSTRVTNSSVPVAEALSRCDELSTGTFVAAMHSSELCIGKILGKEEEKVILQCMRRTPKNPKTYMWPSKEDTLLVKPTDIVSIVETPTATGRSKRAFALSKKDFKRLQKYF